MFKSVAGGALIISFFTLIAKLLGFAREIIIANYFGTSWRYDAVLIALTPAIAITTIFSTGISNAFIPVYHKLKAEGNNKNKVYVQSFLFFISIINLFFGLTLLLFPKFYIKIFAPGFSDEVINYATKSLIVLSIFPLISGAYNILQTLLRAERKFFEYSFSQLIFNIVFIPLLILFAPLINEQAYVVSWVIGNIFILLISIFFTKEYLKKSHFDFHIIKNTFKLAIPIILATTTSEINKIIDKAFVSYLPSGRISSLQYANTLLSFLNIFIVAFLTSSYTELSEYVTSNNLEAAKNRMRKTIKSSLNIAIPIVAWIVIMSNGFISFVFQRGNFNEESVRLVSIALIGYSGLLLILPINSMIRYFLISSGKVFLITFMSILSIFTNTLFDWLFIKPWGHGGITLSTTFVAFITAIIQILYLKRKGISFLPIKNITFNLVIVIVSALLVIYLKTTLNLNLWFILGNLIFVIIFLILARDEIKFLISKIGKEIKKKIKK
ncbi:murein biosynthesis integral membrane protein MurJ [Thermosipho atlanticus]|uniref:Putative peptidoglycan lipid II flippase n=1 Tax=Thermosipho atlanticus DSM 15807 TaxID=1123380 RepID=A0A1M5RPD3_9BACT|nr:lipid II flippase MurJ [Thermosipho atlanticus]SHH28000.1 putative peptidoglycan lipid II flippase [Thermosipho atlanticus DSM 15807]